MCTLNILMQLHFVLQTLAETLRNLGCVWECMDVGRQGLCVFCNSHNSPTTALQAFSDGKCGLTSDVSSCGPWQCDGNHSTLLKVLNPREQYLCFKNWTLGVCIMKHHSCYRTMPFIHNYSWVAKHEWKNAKVPVHCDQTVIFHRPIVYTIFFLPHLSTRHWDAPSANRIVCWSVSVVQAKSNSYAVPRLTHSPSDRFSKVSYSNKCAIG